MMYSEHMNTNRYEAIIEGLLNNPNWNIYDHEVYSLGERVVIDFGDNEDGFNEKFDEGAALMIYLKDHIPEVKFHSVVIDGHCLLFIW